jgi:hypothetical protein
MTMMTMRSRLLTLGGSAFAALAMASLAAAAAAEETKPRPPKALAEAARLLRAIRQAGTAETPLDPQRVRKLFGGRMGADCRAYVQGGQHVHSCRYAPTGPARQGAIRFTDYAVARVGAGPMTGGRVSWQVDSGKLCLTERDLERAFGIASTWPRQPVFPDFFPGSRYVETKSYDFTLVERLPKFDANYVAVYETGGCVQHLTLSTR